MDEQRKDEIHEIWKWASQPRENNWRERLTLLVGLPKQREGVLTAQDLLEFKPQISEICEPLLGRLVKGAKKDILVYPSLAKRLAIYKECLDIVRVFSQPEDLVRLAVFRRHVTHLAILVEIDLPFCELVLYNRPRLSTRNMKRLRNSMPKGSTVRRALDKFLPEEDQETQRLPLAAD